jgi:hypothetical protein
MPSRGWPMPMQNMMYLSRLERNSGRPGDETKIRRLSHWGYETDVTLRRAGNRKAPISRPVVQVSVRCFGADAAKVRSATGGRNFDAWLIIFCASAGGSQDEHCQRHDLVRPRDSRSTYSGPLF